MTRTPDCERYLEDPEANAGHLEECAECRAFFETLDDSAVEHRSVSIDALPLAQWEGASHKPWGLVLSAAAFVVAVVVAFFAVTGVSPRVVASALPPFDVLLEVGKGVHNAPMSWRVVLLVLFLLVNTVLYLLLRRAPKGIDA